MREFWFAWTDKFVMIEAKTRQEAEEIFYKTYINKDGIKWNIISFFF